VFCPDLAPDCNPPTYTFHIVGLQICTVTPGLLLEMEVSLPFYPRLALNHDLCDRSLSLSGVARTTGVGCVLEGDYENSASCSFFFCFL
jgi:hypothetical protein